MSPRRTLATAFGLVACLLGMGLTLAQGLVLCLEADGRMALEPSAQGLACGSSGSGERAAAPFGAIGAGGHCLDCQDVALQLDQVEVVLSSPLRPNQDLAPPVLPARYVLPSPFPVEWLRADPLIDAAPAGGTLRTTVLRI